MTISECYKQINSNYENVLERLGSEDMVKTFVKKFLKDKSFSNLKKAMEEKDVSEAFRAAHTMKGICLNLGFDELFDVSSNLTECLRKGSFDGSSVFFEKVVEKYNVLINAINNIE